MKIYQLKELFPKDVPTVVLAGDTVLFQGEFIKAATDEVVSKREVIQILPFVSMPGPVPNSVAIQPVMRIVVSQSASGIIL